LLKFDFISDGQFTLPWQDLLRPFTDGVEGVRKGPLVRWFNTNTFYYAPIIKDKIRSDGTIIWKSVERRFVKSDYFKVVLPDPLTFAELADDHSYHNKEKLIFAYSDDVLREELSFLAKNGIKYIQLSSPSLVARFRDRPIPRAELKQLGEAIRSAIRGLPLRSGFHAYFGDASPYIPDIFDAIPTDDIGLDFTQTDFNSLQPSKKGIIAGIVNSRSSYLESVDELEVMVKGIFERTEAKSIILSPSCDLQYLPRVISDEKLRRISSLRDRFGATLN
jgi:5-methyltetrahydropteroyltriglutamate--homocysteine methyltransferase